MEPKHLKKDLPKLLQSIKAEDRVLIVGTTRRPFDADLKPFCKVYKKILLIPRPDYSSRLVLWSDVILQNRDLDLSSLAKTTDGYTRGHMVRAMLTDRRVQLQDKKPLSAVEFISPLARQDSTYKEKEEEAFKGTRVTTWYAKTPLGKKRAKAVKASEEDGESGKGRKSKGKKAGKKGKKKKKKKKKK